jgi:hypothetical protein
MQFIETISSPTTPASNRVGSVGGRDQESCSPILGGRSLSERASFISKGGNMQRFLIALLLCLGLVSLAGNAEAQYTKVVSGYLTPGQTNVFYPRVPGNTALDTIYIISGSYSVSGTLSIQQGAEIRFLPNSRIVDSAGGKIIANGFAGLAKQITFRERQFY